MQLNCKSISRKIKEKSYFLRFEHCDLHSIKFKANVLSESKTYLVECKVGAVAQNVPFFSKCKSVVFPAQSNPISRNFPFFLANPR